MFQRRQLSCGVPQGSILGQLLWNIGYDAVLRSALPPSCHVVCYADDTLILAGGTDWAEAIHRGEVATASVVRAIRGAGLEIAAHKTEALFFYSKDSGAPPQGLKLKIGNIQVPINRSLKYLGLVLDGLWSYESHFDTVALRAKTRATTLCRLLPNIGGPDDKTRRLYAGTVRSVALYGAPIWAKALSVSKRGKNAMTSALHPMTLRIARAYRTVSRGAAQILAGSPPLFLIAKEHERTFVMIRRRQQRGIGTTDAIRSRIRIQSRQRTIVDWQEDLATEVAKTGGGRIVSAIQPMLEEWVNRPHGALSFRMTQILSGHGCFGTYLTRIGREETEICHHCGVNADSAQHTLEECSAWSNERRDLRAVTGRDLSLPALIRSIITSKEAWCGLSRFCEIVMTQKEQAERERQAALHMRRGRRHVR